MHQWLLPEPACCEAILEMPRHLNSPMASSVVGMSRR